MSFKIKVYVWKIPPHSYNKNSNTNECTLVKESHLKLRGHRSIVNQCRFNLKYHMLATSGVEKLIKVWTPYRVPGVISGGLLGLPHEYAPQRRLYTFNDLFSFRWSTDTAANTTALTTQQQQQAQRSASPDPPEATDPPASTASASGSTTDAIDPNDLVVMNYQPVIRNRSSLPSTESTEEDRIMIAFFDSQVRRQRRIEETINNSLQNKRKKRTILSKATNQEDGDEHDNLVLSDEDDDDSVSLNSDTFSEHSTESSSDLSSDRSASDNQTSDTSTSVDSDDDDDDGLDLNKLTNRSDSSMQLTSHKKLIPLRDRLRNLRHRQSLNLTQETDYINVLDSLNVSNSGPSTSDQNQEGSNQSESKKTSADQSLKEAKSKLDSTSSSSIEIRNHGNKLINFIRDFDFF